MDLQIQMGEGKIGISKKDILLNSLNKMKAKREVLVKKIQQQIETYEKKRAQEQITYHKMSGLRKLLAGKTPPHHRAVEHLVYVKQPMDEIEKINRELSMIEWMKEKITENDGIENYILPQFKVEILQIYGEEESNL